MRQDHLITATQLSRGDIEAVLDRARAIASDPAAYADRHAGTVLAPCFFAPSTRPPPSCHAAAQPLRPSTLDLRDVPASTWSTAE